MITSMLLDKDELRILRSALSNYEEHLIEDVPNTDFIIQLRKDTRELMRRVDLELDCLDALEEEDKRKYEN